MKSKTILFAALVAAATPMLAQTDKTEGRLTAELTFASIDEAGKGFIDMGDMERFRESVFLGMDYDDDAAVTYPEFAAWDPGFFHIAAQDNKLDAMTTATKIVFSFWDRDGDGTITQSEMRFAVAADFRRADIDDDATLTEAEFINGFAIIVAMRAALRPDL